MIRINNSSIKVITPIKVISPKLNGIQQRIEIARKYTAMKEPKL